MGLSTETCRSCGIKQWPCDCQVAALRRRTDYPGDMLAAERAENAALRAELAAALKERDEARARPVGYWTRENANLQADLDELLKLAKAMAAGLQERADAAEAALFDEQKRSAVNGHRASVFEAACVELSVALSSLGDKHFPMCAARYAAEAACDCEMQTVRVAIAKWRALK